jgi:hypothetical protein
MLEAFPFVPLGGHVRIGVAIFSYDGGVNFGVTADRDGAPDLDLFCQAIERSLGELVPSLPPERRQERAGTGARRAAAKTEG